MQHHCMSFHPAQCAPTLWLTVIVLLLSSLAGQVSSARVTNPSKVPHSAILLSKISTLTLRSGKSTSSRRVSPVPQLQCVGPSSICALYDVDAIRCRNDGADYDENAIQWTCSASLPEEFKLGGTDVSCEGYESSDDPYVLKGSCGLEYRLVLTAAGERRYGLTNNVDSRSEWRGKNRMEKTFTFVFWLIFAGVVVIMALSALGCFENHPVPRGNAAGAPGWGGGGGGGGGPYYDDDPPPPYPGPRRGQKPYTSSQGAPWTPGFWTGAGAGATAGYAFNNRNGRGNPVDSNTSTGSRDGWLGGRSNNAGEGPSYSSGRYESTGFGSTSRR